MTDPLAEIEERILIDRRQYVRTWRRSLKVWHFTLALNLFTLATNVAMNVRNPSLTGAIIIPVGLLGSGICIYGIRYARERIRYWTEQIAAMENRSSGWMA